ncbi:MAG: cyclohexanecarboxylate-CoA ligase [Actinomycetota bacterium]|nr:cyclohexanecarboxylate-CoA ligase [Actinomycetota bacterium]
MPIRATFNHPRATDYTRPGGPWDIASLDTLLSTSSANGRDTRVVDGATRLSGIDLADRVARVAGGLRDAGVEPGDVVAWQSPNRYEAVVLYRACWRLGAIAAPVHHQTGDAERDAQLAAVAPRLVVDVDVLPDGIPVDEIWSDNRALAAVLWTSGSSGAPKGVLHSQRTLAYKAAQMATTHGLAHDDCVLMPAPLAHVSGLLNGITLPGAVPFRSVLMARWDPEHAIDLIERERVTFMIGPPTFFVSLMNASEFSRERVTTLRLVSSGGAGVTEAFVEDAAGRLGCVVKRTYGSTEAPTIATSTPDDEALDARRHDGRAIGAVELRLDANAELLVQGPEVCCGYVDAAQTDEAFTADGWFRTGDLATLDDSWLTIVGRIKDVIIRGGENISATEVENVLEAHPDVAHAVAVGYPDALMGERICAFVVGPQSFGVDACREWFERRSIARYKTPEQVVVVDAFPVLATGKPDRAALRADAASRFDVRR